MSDETQGTIENSDAAVAELVKTYGAFDMSGSEPEPEQIVEEPTKPTPPVEEKKTEDKFAAKFAALSRKEKQQRDRERQFEARMKQMESQFAAREADLKNKFIDPEQFKQRPLDILKERAGLTFEQLAEMELNNGAPTLDMILAKKESEFNEKLKQIEARFEQQEQKKQEDQLEQVLSDFKSGLSSEIENNPDYEMIRASGDGVDLVYEVIELHHSNTQQIMSNKEACDKVEAYLLEEAKSRIEKSTKLKGLLAPQPANTATKAPAQKQQSTTLSNSVSSSVTGKTPAQESEEEVLQRAASLIRWT